MNKLLTISLLLLVVLTAGAQEGKWTTGMNEPDELKGDNGGPYYSYDIKGEGSFVVWDWNDYHFRINTDKGVFDVWYHQSTAVRFTRVTLGLYAMDGKMVDKLENLELLADISGKSAWTYSDAYMYAAKKKIKKMKRALKSGEGYIRILCARRGVPEFDVKITPYLQQ